MKLLPVYDRGSLPMRQYGCNGDADVVGSHMRRAALA
jgi:hypothetical protein